MVVKILWVVWMLPDMICLGGIKCIFSIEEPAHASGCLFGFVRTVCNELLRKSYKTALSATIAYRVDTDVLAVVGHVVLLTRWLEEPS
jgi:hypothetical protein